MMISLCFLCPCGDVMLLCTFASHSHQILDSPESPTHHSITAADRGDDPLFQAFSHIPRLSLPILSCTRDVRFGE